MLAKGTSADHKLDIRYDDIAYLAAQATNMPIVVVGMIDIASDWCYAFHGLPEERSDAIQFQKKWVTSQNDLSKTRGFSDGLELIKQSPSVFEASILFHTSLPLKSPQGKIIGILSILGHKSNQLSEGQKETLNILEKQLIELYLQRIKNTTVKSDEINDKKLLEKLSDGVFELDGNGKCTYANTSIARLLNKPIAEIVDHSIWNLVYHEDVDSTRDYFRHVLKSRLLEGSYTSRLQPVNGTPVWVEQRCTMEYLDGKMIYLRSIARDITETVILKKELEAKEALFRLVSENSTDIITLHAANGNCIFVSSSCKDLLGYDPEYCLGKNPYDYIYQDDYNSFLVRHNIDGFKNRSTKRIEYRLRKFDGSYVWLESFIKPIFNEEGKFTSFQASTRDVSFRRKEREELIIARNKAEEAAQAKNDFLSMMSHEIRTPLNGIIGTTNLLIKKDPNANQLPLINILKQSGDNLLSILNDVLDLHKIEQNKIAFDLHEFNFQELTWLLRDNYEYLASEKGLVLKCYYDPALSESYKGDSVRISQILHNLISNAIKFTEAGEVNVRISKFNQHDGFDEILIEVIDTGIGIPESKHSEIFEAFVQADKDITRRFGGSGLGLSITTKLLSLMNSEIELKSKENHGSTFSFKLALRRMNSQEKISEARQNTEYPAINGKVLIVEDNQFNRLIAHDFLESWGCEVLEAVNGLKALEVIEQTKVDLVLLDLQMPVMDGYETIKTIRCNKSAYYQELPVIAITATVIPSTESELFEYGINDFITKPFIPSELHGKVTSHLNSTKKNVSLFEPIILNKLGKTFGDKDGKVSKYLEIFKETLHEQINVMELALESGAVREVGSHAHKIKSSLKMVGLDSIAAEAEDLENAVDKGNPPDIILQNGGKHLEGLKELYNQLS